jgi:Retrotransposon gag protein
VPINLNDNSLIEQDEQVARALQTKLLEQGSPTKSMFGYKSCADTKSSAMQAPTQIFGTIISDAAVCPKTFGGTTAESAENWLKLFERYADYRNLNDNDRKWLFIILLRGGASDWLNSLQVVEQKTYAELIENFKEAFLPGSELLWTHASALWKQPQKTDGSVQDYFIRMKKCANKVGMTDDMLHYAIMVTVHVAVFPSGRFPCGRVPSGRLVT